MTFEGWLRTQMDRKDEIGKLAREFVTYSDYMFTKHWRRIKCTRDNLLIGSAGFLDQAKKEFMECK